MSEDGRDEIINDGREETGAVRRRDILLGGSSLALAALAVSATAPAASAQQAATGATGGQKPASFNLDRVMQQLSEPGGR
jgi:arylsulfatase